LRTAPVLEADYSGPVLFTGQASAEMFARVLAPNLSGQRLPLTDQQQAQTNRSELVDRLNRPVLPRFLSVFDDPTAQRIGNQELLRRKSSIWHSHQSSGYRHEKSDWNSGSHL